MLGGPVGSWEPLKLMSGDGGGVFNASSAHPFENPSAYTTPSNRADAADPDRLHPHTAG
ncbi:hypothetical protein E4K10_05785 [Streptomyces sp. T1317-0309]|nr:hypothetical protein E4K10_05785 [Streptomyces sp. T1317-0309]